MRTHQSTPQKLQPLTPADLDFIRTLAEDHSVGLEQRCARYRRHADIRRTAVATCLLAVFAIVADIAYANPPSYTGKAIFGDITTAQASDTINEMLSRI